MDLESLFVTVNFYILWQINKNLDRMTTDSNLYSEKRPDPDPQHLFLVLPCRQRRHPPSPPPYPPSFPKALRLFSQVITTANIVSKIKTSTVNPSGGRTELQTFFYFKHSMFSTWVGMFITFCLHKINFSNVKSSLLCHGKARPGSGYVLS
jgi:hypothetical protein